MPPVSAGTRLSRLPAVERRVLGHNMALCKGWLDWLEAHGRKRLTVYQYGSKCEEFLEFVGTSTPLDLVTLEQMEAWVSRPRRGRGHGHLGSDSTRAKDVIMLRGLYKWALAHAHCSTNLALELEMPTVKNHDPRAIDSHVWVKFWGGPLDDFERVAYGLGFFCGLRREEICRLGPHHVDLEMGRIVGFPRKGDRNSRTTGVAPVVSLARLFALKHPQLLPDADSFLQPLKALCVDREGKDWLLPWGDRPRVLASSVPGGMTNPDRVNHRLRMRLRDLGMEGAFTPHALRHSFVTYTLRAGVPLEVVSKLANHSSIAVTQRYIRVADDPIAEMLLDGHGLRGTRW